MRDEAPGGAKLLVCLLSTKNLHKERGFIMQVLGKYYSSSGKILRISVACVEWKRVKFPAEREKKTTLKGVKTSFEKSEI